MTGIHCSAFPIVETPMHFIVRCGGAVFKAEEIVEKGRNFHLPCFTCKGKESIPTHTNKRNKTKNVHSLYKNHHS